jgi:excisionase family DNA binding protein
MRESMSNLLTIEELSAYLRVPVTTLYRWRTRGYGPVGRRMGKHVRYREEDVRAWVDGLDDVAEAA